jgi:hypothetical protein
MLADLRFALRLWRRHPLFACAGVLSIAVAIGANTAVFSLVHAVLVAQLPYRDPDRLVWIWSTRTDRDKAFFCLPDLADFIEQTRTLEELAAVTPWGANFTGLSPAERFAGLKVSGNLFRLLGVRAVMGRLLEPEDDSPSRVASSSSLTGCGRTGSGRTRAQSGGRTRWEASRSRWWASCHRISRSRGRLPTCSRPSSRRFIRIAPTTTLISCGSWRA